MSAPVAYSVVGVGDGMRPQPRSWDVRRYGRFPLVLWAIEQTWPPAGVVARGLALTRPQALEAASRSSALRDGP